MSAMNGIGPRDTQVMVNQAPAKAAAHFTPYSFYWLSDGISKCCSAVKDAYTNFVAEIERQNVADEVAQKARKQHYAATEKEIQTTAEQLVYRCGTDPVKQIALYNVSLRRFCQLTHFPERRNEKLAERWEKMSNIERRYFTYTMVIRSLSAKAEREGHLPDPRCRD